MKTLWQDLIDEKVKEAIGDGDISHLPGAGLPLNLEDDSLTPREYRLAYKIMIDNDVMPSWVMMSHDLDKDRTKILKRLARFAADYQDRLQDAYRAGSEVKIRNAEERRDHACNRIRHDIEKLNSKILDYNLCIPPQIQQKIPLNAGQEIKQAFGI